MDISHPEIEEFIQIRNPTGDNNRRSRNIHNGVNIPDDFMKRVVKDEGWDLISPHTGKVVKTVKARKLWEMCLDTAATKGGEPMIHWVDASNRMLPQSQKDLGLKVNGSNLCVAPETMVLTDQGYKQIQSLAGQMVNIWNGEEWSLSAVAQTGEDQPLIKVTFSNGMSLYCKRPVGVDVIKQPLTEYELYQSTFFSLTILVALGKAFTAPYGTEVGVNTVWVEASAQRQETLIVMEQSKPYNWIEPNNYSLSYDISENTMSGGAAALLIEATGLVVPDRFEDFDFIGYEVDSSGNIVGDGWLWFASEYIEKSTYPTLSVKLNKTALDVSKRYRFAFSLKYAAALTPRRWNANYSAAHPAIP